MLLVLPALGMTLKFGITLKLPGSLHRYRKMPPALLWSLSALTGTAREAGCSQACPFRKERRSETCRDAPGHPQRHRQVLPVVQPPDVGLTFSLCTGRQRCQIKAAGLRGEVEVRSSLGLLVLPL